MKQSRTRVRKDPVSGIPSPPPIPHAPDCKCDPLLHRYKCKHCKRVVGWCMGAHDAVERRSGPICDDCVCLLIRHDESLLDLAETLEQMEQDDPTIRAAAAHYYAAVKRIVGEGGRGVRT